MNLDIDVLNSELSSLDTRSQLKLAPAQSCPYQEGTHRQNSQQRRLASILQPDHGDVHLGCPVQWSLLAVILGHCRTQLCFFRGSKSMR
jgi:hypothetical protein